MGVDYYAHYGIGVKIKVKDIDDFYSYLDERLDIDKYYFFCVGEGSYTGKEDDWYIRLKKYDLLNDNPIIEKELLLKHLEYIGIETDGEFGLVGGLEVS